MLSILRGLESPHEDTLVAGAVGVGGGGLCGGRGALGFLFFWRYLQYRWHPEDANQYSGMWAGGNLVLGVFIFCLLLVPTFFLVLILRKSEAGYTGYAKVLLVVSLTAPASVGLFAIPAVRNSNSLLGWVCMWRLFGSPFVLIGIVGSRLLARFPRAKRLCSYAALIEAGTLVMMILLLGVAGKME